MTKQIKALKNILSLIGNTPLIELHKITAGFKGNFYAKVEAFNPGHSSKDRIALFIIEQAEKKRILKPGGVITAQVGSNDKKPKQVENWCKVLDKSFGNVRVSGVHIPSFDCNWNFASSIMK